MPSLPVGTPAQTCQCGRQGQWSSSMAPQDAWRVTCTAALGGLLGLAAGQALLLSLRQRGPGRGLRGTATQRGSSPASREQVQRWFQPHLGPLVDTCASAKVDVGAQV